MSPDCGDAHPWYVSTSGGDKIIHHPDCPVMGRSALYTWLGNCTLDEAARKIADDPHAWQWHRGCARCVAQFEPLLCAYVAINEGITS